MRYWDDWICDICAREFASEDNLLNHEITHREADIECYGCNQFFTTYGGMIIHLESGACASRIDAQDLNRSAAKCFQWKKWTNKAFRWRLLNYGTIEKGEYPYKCPCCESAMPKLSSLFMHVASQACEETLDEGTIGKLQRYLFNRHWGGENSR
ncbi:hypothetical protein BCR34DRAFT_606345 [Clohesyomyces aquaticus]|uniref:C2H2-type domain-containing protein n=1 Tax=Clohesyomyces aquaticus TaxID=1231657 RepID=A0A1Y1YQJ6_9PLEO|nr:hypothetical protein BCR34DRAFT_606345 [Clohesyomyces aquaticus]